MRDGDMLTAEQRRKQWQRVKLFALLKLPCGIFRAYCFATRLKASFSHSVELKLCQSTILVRFVGKLNGLC